MKNQRFLPMLNIRVLIVIASIVMSCTSDRNLDIQGHRGCRGLMPENTLPAFNRAIDLGVTTLELDIAITKDNEVVVSHEPFMSRTICYNPSGNEITSAMDMRYNLYNMSHDEIKQFDCGTKFHPSYPDQAKLKTYKPLLKEVFHLVTSRNSEVRFNIEIKSKPTYYGIFTPEPKAYVKLVLDEIKAHNMLHKVNLQSFDLLILEEIKEQAPDMMVALLIDDDESIAVKLAELSYQPEIISPYFKLLTKEVISDYQKKGFKIIPWTVNKEKDLVQMLNWGVDGIITDYPNRLNTIRPF